MLATRGGGSARKVGSPALAREPIHVPCDTRCDIRKPDIATGIAERGQFRLGVALIFPPERLRDRDVADQSLGDHLGQRQRALSLVRSAGIHGRLSDIVERLGAPRAEIEYSASFGMLEEPEVYGHDIVHEYEIPLLLPRTVPAVFAE
jgi:hypothetical protein